MNCVETENAKDREKERETGERETDRQRERETYYLIFCLSSV